MAEQSTAELLERGKVRLVVVEVFQEEVLKAHAPTTPLDVAFKRSVQMMQRRILHMGHNGVACRLHGGVKRHGKRELLGLVCEALDAFQDAAC